MGAAAWGAERALAAIAPGDELIPRVMRVALAIGVALVVLAAGAHILKVREFAEARALLLGRFRRART
jgi:hypothetical protein